VFLDPWQRLRNRGLAFVEAGAGLRLEWTAFIGTHV
jgi:hypothetical protein